MAFAGVAKYPARVKCALLAWMAFKDATAQARREERRCSMSETGDHGGARRRRGGACATWSTPSSGINVVDLGLVYGIHVDDENVATLDMTLTSAACPLTDVIEDQTRRRSRPVRAAAWSATSGSTGCGCRRGVRTRSPTRVASSSAPSASTSDKGQRPAVQEAGVAMAAASWTRRVQVPLATSAGQVVGERVVQVRAGPEPPVRFHQDVHQAVGGEQMQRQVVDGAVCSMAYRDGAVCGRRCPRSR